VGLWDYAIVSAPEGITDRLAERRNHCGARYLDALQASLDAAKTGRSGGRDGSKTAGRKSSGTKSTTRKGAA
jgi:hypothetical protein